MTTISRPRTGSGGADRSETQDTPTWTLAAVGEWLRSPVAPYYLILVSAAALATLGLVMVLSASSVGSFLDSGSSYTVFLSQVVYAAGGFVLAVIGARLPVAWWKKLAWPAIFLAVMLQLLVFTPLGMDAYQGNRNWLEIGGRTVQPSEFGKLALVVFGAAILETKRRLMHKPLHATVPLVFPFGIVLLGLVLQGHDLGTGLILLTILVGLLWSAGLPGRWFLGLGAVAVAGVGYLAAGSANRMSRIQVWLGGICDGPHAAPGCFQKVHAEWALADGGWWGLGLGESREKWGLLPEPHNDFILAIIGEELGLPGSLMVLALFGVLAYACFRIVSQSEDTFSRLAASGVMIWFLAQALLNIGSVIGMLPIIGVPLPLVSSGGSALVAAMMGVGLLLSLARGLPGARERLGGRPGTLRHTFSAVPTGSRRGAGQRPGSRPGEASRSVDRRGTNGSRSAVRRGTGSRSARGSRGAVHRTAGQPRTQAGRRAR